MGRIITFLIILTTVVFSFSFLFSGKTSYAQTAVASKTISRPFGGRIIEGPRATKILDFESFGYNCPTDGPTFDIIPVGPFPKGPYFLLVTKDSELKGSPVPKKWIIGLYSTVPKLITCTNPETEDIATFNAYTVTLYGISKI